MKNKTVGILKQILDFENQTHTRIMVYQILKLLPTTIIALDSFPSTTLCKTILSCLWILNSLKARIYAGWNTRWRIKFCGGLRRRREGNEKQAFKKNFSHNSSLPFSVTRKAAASSFQNSMRRGASSPSNGKPTFRRTCFSLNRQLAEDRLFRFLAVCVKPGDFWVWKCNIAEVGKGKRACRLGILKGGLAAGGLKEARK